MQVRRPPSDEFRLEFSELCEAGFNRLAEDYPLIFDVYEFFEFALKRLPSQRGEATPAFPDTDRQLLLLMTPPTRNYPSLRVLFEITGRTVLIWHICVADQG